MIFANVRAQLTRDDAQLALRLVARGSAGEYDHAEARLRDDGIDTLLDDPRLLAALLEAPQGAHASMPSSSGTRCSRRGSRAGSSPTTWPRC